MLVIWTGKTQMAVVLAVQLAAHPRCEKRPKKRSRHRADEIRGKHETSRYSWPSCRLTADRSTQRISAHRCATLHSSEQLCAARWRNPYFLGQVPEALQDVLGSRRDWRGLRTSIAFVFAASVVISPIPSRGGVLIGKLKPESGSN